MKLKALIFLTIILLVFSNCTSSKKTIVEKDFSLSTLYHKTDKENLYYKLPAGWSEIKDNHEQLFDLWLVSPNNKSTITFIPIHTKNNLTKATGFDLLQTLMKTKNKIKESSLKNFSPISKFDKFENNNIQFISMKYLDDGNIKRSVILGKDKSIYECIAYFESSYEPTDDEIAILFEVQQLVLLSLQMKNPLNE